MKRQAAAVFLCLVILVSFPQKTWGEEIVSRGKGMDIIFVVDCSGSMKSNDPKGIGKEMVKAFIDTVHTEDIRIGYVAYNDTIVSSAPPVSISDPGKRRELRDLISSTPYSGDTDIGLGLSRARSFFSYEEGRSRSIVLLSDGETDLNGLGERTMEQSSQDLTSSVEQCREKEIPIYTIAFGEFEGSRETLKSIAAETGAESYFAETPEALIEVMYGILNNQRSYQIQQFSSGVYGGGRQEIRCVFDEVYLDEMDVLLISSGKLGDTVLQYGEKQIPMTNLSYYAVGKIESGEIDDSIRELIVSASTEEGQSMRIFLICYRKLLPVFKIESSAPKNKPAAYQVYFKDKAGNVIKSEEFYKKFRWELSCEEEPASGAFREEKKAEVSGGVLQGAVGMNRSGAYRIRAVLSDALGTYPFDAVIEVANTPPSGSLPEIRMNVLSGQTNFDLNAFFQDLDKDELLFSMDPGREEQVELLLDGQTLTLKPKSSGTQTLTLYVSDGEDTLAYPLPILVVPLWQAYWWVIALFCIGAAAILWKILYRPKPEQIAGKKGQNHFAGQMDACVTAQPQDKEKIPPLTFPMYKMRDVRVCIGDLMREYPELSDELGLDAIFLIADKDRKMILYHSTSSTVMMGSSMVCRNIQYHVSFGDIIYITSPDGGYELEIHYIAMIT